MAETLRVLTAASTEEVQDFFGLELGFDDHYNVYSCRDDADLRDKLREGQVDLLVVDDGVEIPRIEGSRPVPALIFKTGFDDFDQLEQINGQVETVGAAKLAEILDVVSSFTEKIRANVLTPQVVH